MRRSLFALPLLLLTGLVFAATATATGTGVHAWGMNESAQLGVGSNEGPEDCYPGPASFPCSKVPVSASGLGEAKSLDGGAYHSLAVRSDGTVMAWGNNANGQLGTGDVDGPEECDILGGTIGCAKVPTQVPGLGPALEVAAGETFSVALLEDGTVWAWGSGYRGQLGDGTNEGSDSPVQVSGLEHVQQIAAGGAFALALLEDGTVMAWGDNRYGELGDGTTNDSNEPVLVEELENVEAISAGGDGHALALLEDGTVWAWGANATGQLGNGENTGPDECPGQGSVNEPCSQTPVQVQGITTGTAIAAGGEQNSNGFSLAVLEGGAVKAWGHNESGQLGNGGNTDSDTPVSVSGITEAKSVAAGFNAGYALLNNGTVKAWGHNLYGELGDGSTEPTSTPVAVDGLDGVTAIGAGWMLGLASGTSHPLPSVTGLSPKYGPLIGGTLVTITGSGFTGATAVEFGSTPAIPFTVVSDTEITAISPPAPPGTGGVNVRVTTPNGISATNDATIFSYGPIVTGVQPNDGPPSGGTEVTITGGNFIGATEVMFGTEPATAFSVNSDTSITATSPPGSDVVDVTVTGPGGTSEVNPDDRFGYGPIVSDIEPNGGPAAGGTEITISGFGLTDVEGVHFGSVPAASFEEHGDGTVTAISPPFAGTSARVPVTVTAHEEVSTTPNYSTLLPPNYFAYEPAVTSITPTEGPSAGGTAVVIHGTGFDSVWAPDEIGGAFVTAVYFGSTEAKFTIVSETELKAVSPPGTGVVDVTVETYAGTSPTGAADRFTYISPPGGGEGGGGATPPGQIAQPACPDAAAACPTPPRHCPKGKVRRHGKCVKKKHPCRGKQRGHRHRHRPHHRACKR